MFSSGTTGLSTTQDGWQQVPIDYGNGSKIVRSLRVDNTGNSAAFIRLNGSPPRFVRANSSLPLFQLNFVNPTVEISNAVGGSNLSGVYISGD